MTLLFDEDFRWVDPKDWERCRNRLDVADVYSVPHLMVIHDLLTPEAARFENELSYNFIYSAGPETLERVADMELEDRAHRTWAHLTLFGFILALCAVIYVLCAAAYLVGWALGS